MSGASGSLPLAEGLAMSDKKARKSRDDPFLQQIVQSDIQNEREHSVEDFEEAKQDSGEADAIADGMDLEVGHSEVDDEDAEGVSEQE